MIFKIAAIFAIIGAIAWIGKWLIDTYSKDNEQLRKLVHILHGLSLAALAFVVPLKIIAVIEIVFLLSVLIARYTVEHFDYIPWIAYCRKVYQVGRLSYGEFFYPVSVIILVFLAESASIFAVAILILAVSDTLAALVGKKYGASNTYLVFKQKKSLAGSLAFFVTAFAIIWVFSLFGNVPFAESTLGLLLLTALLVTIAENLGVYGSDNLLIPIVAVILLNRL